MELTRDDAVPRAPGWLVALLALLVTLPLLAAMVGQVTTLGTDYHAVGDLADIELHTRDVGVHPVELGQYSRGDWAHPGPAQFYAFALPYRLMGSHSVGMNVTALLFNAASIVGILFICHRRGGVPLLWLSAVALAVVVRGFGPDILIEPWNPSVPVLPFGLFLFLLWDVACGRGWALPVAAAVGTFCAQTHVGYLPLTLPLGGLAVVIAAWRSYRRADHAALPKQLLIAGAVTFGVLAVLWMPPVIEELGPGEGNLTRIYEFFKHGEGEPHTLQEGYRSMAEQLELLPDWVTGTADVTDFTGELDVGARAPVPLLLVPFVAGVAVWWRRRGTVPLVLAALSGTAAVLSVIAIVRTLGPLYQYRLGWTRLVAMAMLLVPAWAGWTIVAERWRPLERRLLVPVCGAIVGILAIVGAVRFAHADAPMAGWTNRLYDLAPGVIDSLPPGDGSVIVRCDGDEGCIYLGGLVLWMERQGIDVRVDNPFGLIVTAAPHRGYDGGPVRSVLHVGVGPRYYTNAVRPDVEMVAHVGPDATPERAAAAEELLDLEAAYAAGEIDAETHFFAREELIKDLDNPVGVFIEPL